MWLEALPLALDKIFASKTLGHALYYSAISKYVISAHCCSRLLLRLFGIILLYPLILALFSYHNIVILLGIHQYLENGFSECFRIPLLGIA